MSDPLIDNLRSLSVVVCGGAGGVGKTTVSASLGTALAVATHKRVLILTVDPAKRLASSLGLDALSSEPTDISALLRDNGVSVRSGAVAASVLDVRDAWNGTVRRYAKTRADADRLIENPFYQSLTTSFVGAQEYAALETLYELNRSKEYDCIVIDTPPSQNALDLIEAPRHYGDFAGAKLLSLLSSPMRLGFRAFTFAASPVSKMASVLLGSRSFEDLLDFVEGFQYLQSGIQERALAITRLLSSERCGFVVVTTLEDVQFREAEQLTAALRDMSMSLRGIIVNKAFPSEFRSAAFREGLEVLSSEAALAARHAGHLAQDERDDFLAGLERVMDLFAARAREEERIRRRFVSLGRAPVARLPYLPRDLSNIAGVAELAGRLRVS